jgi:hypothetical protein
MHEVRGFAQITVLTLLFCKMNIFPLLDELPQKIIPDFIMQ